MEAEARPMSARITMFAELEPGASPGTAEELAKPSTVVPYVNQTRWPGSSPVIVAVLIWPGSSKLAASLAGAAHSWSIVYVLEVPETLC